VPKLEKSPGFKRITSVAEEVGPEAAPACHRKRPLLFADNTLWSRQRLELGPFELPCDELKNGKQQKKFEVVGKKNSFTFYYKPVTDGFALSFNYAPVMAKPRTGQLLLRARREVLEMQRIYQ